MANFTIADIKALRDQLGTGMVDTKKALEEADGDVEKAVEILRLKGAKGNAKRADRSTSEGLVAAREQDGKVTLIELACETDFVAKNDRFIALADKVADAAAAVAADSVEAALAAPAGAPDRRAADRRRGRDHRREGRTASRAHALGRQVRGLPAQDQQGPAPAGRRRPRLLGRRRRDRAQPRAAHLVREPVVPRRATRSPRPTSRRSARSSPRSRATRASPRPPCRRSSRAASTRSSSRSRCSTRTTRRTTSCPSRRSPRTPG